MRDLRWIAILLFSFIILLIFTVQIATAIGPQETTAPRPTGVITAPMGNVSARTIGQMDTVYWGETIDMKLVVGWDNMLVHADTGRLVDVSSFTRRILISPDVFLLGEWDKWSPYREDAANSVAFYVRAAPPANANTSEIDQNVTVNITSPISITLGEPEDRLERKHVADLLVAKGDPLKYTIMSNSTPAKVWIFGVSDKLYDIRIKNRTLTLTGEQTQSLDSGSYHLVLQTAGKNRLLEATYVNASSGYPSTTEHIESDLRRTPFLELSTGMGSQVVYEKFMEWIRTYSDDGIQEFDLEVQVPMVDISAIDESFSEGNSVWQVRGYTNLAKGTEIQAIFDEDKQTAETLPLNTYTTTAFGDVQGDMREFAVTIPIDYDNTPVGEHFITARSSFGTFSKVQRWIYNMPAGQEKPAETTKYSGGNLFVPTPTPEIVKVTETVEVVKTVIVTITPEPTPTPVPTPWYFESPWFYIEILVAIVFAILVGLWILWKFGMI